MVNPTTKCHVHPHREPAENPIGGALIAGGLIVPSVAEVGIVGGTIPGYTPTAHGLHQAISRDGVGVAPAAILDAVKNPERVILQAEDAMRYVGAHRISFSHDFQLLPENAA